MVGNKTTIILFLVFIQIYLSIQATVLQPADILGDASDPENQRHNKIDKRCRSQRRNHRMCQCCGTETFFVEYGTICRRYCYRQYHVDGKGRNNGYKGVPMTCTLQNGYNVTAQDAQDNLFPLRPALVPAKNIMCHIKKQDNTTIEVPLLEVFQFDPDQPHPSTKPPKPTSPPGPVLFQDNDLQTPELCPAIIIRKKRATECKTTNLQDDDSPLSGHDKPCIFPFTTFVDKEKKIKHKYGGCTKDGCGEKDCPKHWCSIKVDANGIHTNGLGNWGYCNDECPKINEHTTWCHGEFCPDATTKIVPKIPTQSDAREVEDNNNDDNGNNCKTTTFIEDSPQEGRGKSCIFPFTAYTDQEKKNKKTFYGCTTELCGDAAGCNGFWCSTKVDQNGMHVQGQGNWGYCNSKCQKDEKISVRPPPSDTSIENYQKLSYEDKKILSTCHTTGGPQKKKPCVFPFKYEGKIYDSCNEHVSAYGQTLNTLVKGWCATDVDSDDNFIKDKWGYCDYYSCPFEGEDKECKTYSGPNNDGKCKFPFTLKNGTVYDTCITTDDRCGVPWCPTEKHENAVDLESGSWGYCNHYCPDDGEA